ncbi:MAG: MarR family winged helix-turn-helix transcriptional regulator [Acidobacteriota bacterium]
MDSFRRIVQALRSSHRVATNMKLTGAQLFVLTTLDAATEPIGVNELAEETRTDQSTVSVVVGRLVERRLVKRERSDMDSRRVELSLTARGRAMLRKTPATVAQQKLASALADLSAFDARNLSRLLKTIVAGMGEADSEARMLFDEREAHDTGNVRRARGQPRAHSNATRRTPQATPSRNRSR